LVKEKAVEHGLSAVVIRLQFLLFVLFVSACLALSAGTASAAPPDGKSPSGGLRLPVTGTFAPCITPGALSSLTDLVTGAARLTVTLINGLVALLNQTLGQLF
jgi:hypothetical protein